MSLESGTYVDDLVITNPPAGDDTSQGDDHLRLIKTVLKNTFPGSTKAFRFPTAVAAKTADYTVALATDQNGYIPINATSGAKTVNLPAMSSGYDGFTVTIFKSDATAYPVTIDGSGSDLINGELTAVLYGQYDAITLTWCDTFDQWFGMRQGPGSAGLLNSLILSAGDSVTAYDYLSLMPTDYGTGKPGLFFAKDTTADVWNIGLYDGVDNGGLINFLTDLGLVNGTLSGYLDIDEISTPSTPSANVARLFAWDSSGLTKLAYKDGGGIVREVATAELIKGYNAQVASYTLVIGDAGKLVSVSNASANTLTVPPNSSVAFPLNSYVNVAQLGAGQTTITAGSGVTIRSRGSALKLSGQYAVASLVQIAADEWLAAGDLTT